MRLLFQCALHVLILHENISLMPILHYNTNTHFLPSIRNLYLILLLSFAFRLSAFRTTTHKICFEKHKFSISSQSKFAYSFRWYIVLEFFPLPICLSAHILDERSNIAMPFRDIAIYTSYEILLSIVYKAYEQRCNGRHVWCMAVLITLNEASTYQ